MLIKRLLIIVLSFVMICGVFGCKDKNADSGDGYILPETEIFINVNSIGMQYESKFTYEYDSYGNIVKEERYEKGKFRYIRECCIDRTYTYDENGKITKEIIREEHFRTSITNDGYVFEDGYNYFYNESGQLITKDIIYISAAEDDLCGYKYEYDEYGNCIKESEYFSDGMEIVIFEYKYDSNNKLVSKSCISTLNRWSKPHFSEETTYSYDDDGKLIYSKTVSFDIYGEPDGYSEIEYSYDEYGRLVKEETTHHAQDGRIVDEFISEYKDFVKP